MTTKSPPLNPEQLRKMSATQLDELFRQSPTGPIPDGDTRGMMIVRPGTPFSAVAATVLRAILWQGKVFYPERGILYNKVTPLRIHAEKANVYKELSWFDGREAIVVDYATTGIVSRWIRDEIREVAPGLYLGMAYRRKTRQRWLYFTLVAGF